MFYWMEFRWYELIDVNKATDQGGTQNAYNEYGIRINWRPAFPPSSAQYPHIHGRMSIFLFNNKTINKNDNESFVYGPNCESSRVGDTIEKDAINKTLSLLSWASKKNKPIKIEIGKTFHAKNPRKPWIMTSQNQQTKKCRELPQTSGPGKSAKTILQPPTRSTAS